MKPYLAVADDGWLFACPHEKKGYVNSTFIANPKGNIVLCDLCQSKVTEASSRLRAL